MQVSLAETKDVFKNGRADFLREILYTWGGIAITAVATAFTAAEVVALFADGRERGDWIQMAEQVGFALIVAGLVFGNLDYQLSRLGYFERMRRHQPEPDRAHDFLFDGAAPPLTVLVPSYREQLRVIEQTVLSAALQRYPDRRVVLLIDDAPAPDDSEDHRALGATRALIRDLNEGLRKRSSVYEEARQAWLERRATSPADLREEYRQLAVLCSRVAVWFEDAAVSYRTRDHTDALFVDLVLRKQGDYYRRHAASLLSRAGGSSEPSTDAVDREYRRLATVFRVEVTSFERKRYANLSHESNKAMNLNSYLSLMGRSFRAEVLGDGARTLVESDPDRASLRVAAPDYVVTLDADSLLHPAYALRLTRVMEREENSRLAVVQTPYSAIPDPERAIERVAGATTDVRYVIHQGSTLCDATFWVGANALIRRRALEDIVELDEERGYPIRRYIQDRTVIEDTESSVDLIDRGWSLYNYPERLSFSATPDDFGSLLIQRRRWANGGLIILPKLLRYLWRRGLSLRKLGEAYSRIHYLTSIPVVTFAVLALLFYPFEDNLRSFWFPLTAVPYFALYGRDLVQAGYRASDLFRVYVLNLMLLPINVGGVVKSLQQSWTQEKIPFIRTPKVAGRVGAPAGYVLAEYSIVLGLLSVGVWDLLEARWLHAAFGFFSAGCFAYALVVFVGLRASLEDLRRPLGRSTPTDLQPRKAPTTEISAITSSPS